MPRWQLADLPAVLWAAPVLAGGALLPSLWATVGALAAIIVLGVPHGALDGEIARDILRPRFGHLLWLPLFAVPYIALSALVLLAWHAWPLWTLAGFLAASVWHFGTEDAEGSSRLEQAVRGGLPIAVPTLVHAGATGLVFTAVTGEPMDRLPAWLVAGVAVWLALAAVWAARCACRRCWASLLGPSLLAGLFVALPPLIAFAIYFVCVHAPAHTSALVKDRRRACRVHDARSAVLRALPLSVVTVLIGILLWPLYSGPVPVRLLALTLQGLAALTLPHMLLEVASNGLARPACSTAT